MRILSIVLLVLLSVAPNFSTAQSLEIATVTRTPFSLVENGKDTGFSLDLWQAVAEKIGVDYTITRYNSFGEMLGSLESGAADAAVANISITASREQTMDFTHPIFESGLQIMTPASKDMNFPILAVISSREVLLSILGAFAVLFGLGMLMWVFERRAQPYFDKPMGEAAFPSFWWALNLVVNGGFEERAPRTPMGRLLGVVLVVSSLFVVSIFVAQITTAMTVKAISGSITSVSDLYTKRVATIEGSTSAQLLMRRDVRFETFANLDELYEAFETGGIEAVVFDAPILAYYVLKSEGRAALVGSSFSRENYGIALPSGSPYQEQMNQALLNLREDGTYQSLIRKWFGQSNN